MEESDAWRRAIRLADRYRAPSGEMFMTDAYGNARVHKFSADGKHLFSWGEPGNAPRQFNLPHGVWIEEEDFSSAAVT